EGHLHAFLGGPAGAGVPGVRPPRPSSPLPLLDHWGVGLFDENPDPSQHLAPPIPQLLNSRIDQLSDRLACIFLPRAALPLLARCCLLLRLPHRLPRALTCLLGSDFAAIAACPQQRSYAVPAG